MSHYEGGAQELFSEVPGCNRLNDCDDHDDSNDDHHEAMMMILMIVMTMTMIVMIMIMMMIMVMIIKLHWNCLPESLKSLESLTCFKKRLKQQILSSY